jgi:hypothetical protein
VSFKNSFEHSILFSSRHMSQTLKSFTFNFRNYVRLSIL